MKKKLLIISSLVVALSIMFMFQQMTQAQAPTGNRQAGGGAFAGMMMMMQILPLESEWTYISFEIGVNDDALIKARKAFQDAWTKRKAVISKSDQNGDDANAKRAMKADLEKIKSELDAKLKGILTPKQLEDIAKWQKENQNRMKNRPAGGPGGGGQPPK